MMKENADAEADTNYYYDSSSSANDSDDDEVALTLRKSPHDAKLWDSFQDPPVHESSASSIDSKVINQLIKLMKIATYWIVLLVVASASVLSKLTFLLMTSNAAADTKTSFCDTKLPEKRLLASLAPEQNIAWRWALIFAFSIPEVGTWLRAIRLCCFKKIKNFGVKEFFAVLLAESLHVIGMCLLTFAVLPEMDSLQGAMLTNCLCLVPGVLCMFSRPFDEAKVRVKKILDISSIVVQLLGWLVWPLAISNAGPKIWFLPLAALLVSCRWWENFVTYCSPWEPIQYLAYLRDKCYDSRYKMYAIIAPYKILLFFTFTAIVTDTPLEAFFADFYENFTNHTVTISEVKPVLNRQLPDFDEITSDLYHATINTNTNVIWWTLLTHALASYACYIFVPLMVSTLIVLCGLRHADVCAFHDSLPDYTFFRSPPADFLFGYVFRECVWLWVAWLFAQSWIARHLWRPKGMRNASTEKLFILPMYDSLLVDQSMAMNRRRDEYEEFVDAELDQSSFPEPLNVIDAKAYASHQSKEGVTAKDHVPQIFVCATMWHETKEELITFLKSILRLDEDQCARRMAMKYLQMNKNEIDSEYYDLETHIFFDDAFVGNKSLCESPEATPINAYVKLLVNSVEEAAREVYKVKMKIPPPIKIVCPYGGRLIWTLPGRTKMVAHLKDKNKIRHKKRWSQVMYMYYLLGYRIMQLDASPERKRIIAQNTYLLTLDGDIDFQPHAVTLLVDRMKNDAELGAACGRIHPIGNGPMVWYQVFEYAIGHWLQKATEHVIGCVLCSPGCFSLFRGRALMENSVMRKYTTKSDQARHYIQYDQGEDRWLCTLILKQKYRVEYCAASDAYTHAPEGFNEFYSQRRRWVPSTIANIFDLLSDADKICEVNNNISRLYIFYQCILMFGTIIGPGTIFLMMVSAIQSVFLVDIYYAFLYNFVPLITFMLICYLCKSKIQLLAAFIISIIYSLIMMAVMVGIMIQVIEDGLFAPSSMFFMTVTFQIIVTGILHPQEIYALPAGFIYYVTIPCMYMLLTVYSLFNMNDVSWGTRENPQEASAAPKVAKSKTKFQKILGFLRPTDDNEEEGSLDISFAGLFRCMFCTHKKADTTNSQLLHVGASLAELNSRIRSLEQKLTNESPSDDDMEINGSDDDGFEDVPLLESSDKEKANNLLPDWLYDPDLREGDTETISAAEEQFWMDLIDKYLRPIEMTEKYKANMESQLRAYRDISVFAFTMGNALFVLIVFLLQLNKQYLKVKWPFDVQNNIVFDQTTFEFTIRQEFTYLEPISMLFVGFFGFVLIVQFIAMLFHRFATISQILATTKIDWYFSKKVKDTMSSSELRENAVDIARHLQSPRPEWQPIEDDDEELPTTTAGERRGRRDTIHQLLLQHKKQKDWSNLETNFKRELFKDGELRLRKLKFTRKTLETLDYMRKSMAEFKRKKKSLEIVNPYAMATSASSYSLATSDKDSFTIYQRTTYRKTSPIPSVVYSTAHGMTADDSRMSLESIEMGLSRRSVAFTSSFRQRDGPLLPLKSALKKSKTLPAISTSSQGIDNPSFVEDKNEMHETAGLNGDESDGSEDSIYGAIEMKVREKTRRVEEGEEKDDKL